MAEPMSTTIFFSHSSKDATWVDHLSRQARASGVETYLAEHDVSPGVQLSDKVRRNIEDSDAVLVLITENSWQSAYVQQEIGLALQAGKLVIPIVSTGAAHVDLGLLAGVEYILLDRSAPQDALARLSATLSEFVRRREAEVDRRVALERDAARRDLRLMMAGMVVVFGLMVLSES
jgi:hypothetical protein